MREVFITTVSRPIPRFSSYKFEKLLILAVRVKSQEPLWGGVEHLHLFVPWELQINLLSWLMNIIREDNGSLS